MIRIALVDDHALMRFGIKGMLADDAEFNIVAEGQTGDEAVAICKQHKLDVLLLDINMPGGMSGIEALERIQRVQASVKVLIVSQHREVPLIRSMLDRGAAGYVTKTAGVDELKKAIRLVNLGRRYVDNELAQSMAFAPMQERMENIFAPLSARELEVLIAMVNGTSNKELSNRLHVSEKTVSTYKSRIHEKVGTNSDVELVRLAIAQGLVPDVFVPSKRDLSSDS